MSPVELLSEIKKRTEDVNPKINAFNFYRFDESLKEAKEAEKKYSQNKETLPLEGIPLAIKDEVNIKGQPNKNGSLIFKDYIADKTDIDVESLPIKRIGRNRFVRNVLYAIGNSGNNELINSAEKLQSDLDPVVRDAADWAIAKLKGSRNV